MLDNENDLDRLGELIAKARTAGADAADAMQVRSASLDASWRMGKNEGVERSEASDLGLRVLIGTRQAVVSTTDLGDSALAELVDRAVAMAKAVPEDPNCGLADPALLATSIPDLDLADTIEPESQALLDLAAEAEDAARAVEGITNSEGADASWGRSTVALANSDGFAGGYAGTRFTVVASVVAGTDKGMERDYEYHTARHFADLESPAGIGRQAGERAVARLNPRKQESGQYPVVFDPRVSGGFLRLLAMSVSGTAIVRGTSFLQGKLGEGLFADGVTITDDPLRTRGMSSRPFDGEAVACQPLTVVENGRLRSWILDSRSGRQLDLATTGHASRGPSSSPSPSPSNLYMQAGSDSRDDLIGAIDNGLYVTEMMGMSFNSNTGDYSRGAAGFWIENGELTYPVSEMTVAGNLLDMFPKMTPASDLAFRYGLDAPTLRIDGMTVAGL
jgi:PmbA protein